MDDVLSLQVFGFRMFGGNLSSTLSIRGKLGVFLDRIALQQLDKKNLTNHPVKSWARVLHFETEEL